MWTSIRPINRKTMGHYQALWGAKCGSPILVYWDGKRPEKTQVDEHEAKCPNCKAEYRKIKLERICSKLEI